MTTIKKTPGPGSITTPPVTDSVSQESLKQAAKANPEAYAKALKDYKKMQENLRRPMLKGAAQLFADGISFPEELLDPKNPINDPKYLHLMCSIFGLKDLEQFFATVEQREESEQEESDDTPEEDPKDKKKKK